MAVTTKNIQQPEPPVSPARVEPAPALESEAKPFDGNCVVDDGTRHMGRATPGAKICSAHAMHYYSDGTPRQ